MRRLLKNSSLVAVCLLGGACSSGATTSGTTTTVSGDATTTAAGSDTTVAPTTAGPTTLPATTTTVAAEVLELRFDGLGPYDFGSTPAAVIDAITAYLGAPTTNEVLLYEDATHAGDGYYVSLAGPYYYALEFPVGQTACWAGDFCAEFGGNSEPDLHFIGWSYSGPALTFTSSANLTIGSRQSDFPSMSVYPTCYTTAGGTHTGMTLIVATNIADWQWLVDDGTGNFVPNLAPPDTVRVTFMEAGSRPFQPEGDC